MSTTTSREWVKASEWPKYAQTLYWRNAKTKEKLEGELVFNADTMFCGVSWNRKTLKKAEVEYLEEKEVPVPEIKEDTNTPEGIVFTIVQQWGNAAGIGLQGFVKLIENYASKKEVTVTTDAEIVFPDLEEVEPDSEGYQDYLDGMIEVHCKREGFIACVNSMKCKAKNISTDKEIEKLAEDILKRYISFYNTGVTDFFKFALRENEVKVFVQAMCEFANECVKISESKASGDVVKEETVNYMQKVCLSHDYVEVETTASNGAQTSKSTAWHCKNCGMLMPVSASKEQPVKETAKEFLERKKVAIPSDYMIPLFTHNPGNIRLVDLLEEYANQFKGMSSKGVQPITKGFEKAATEVIYKIVEQWGNAVGPSMKDFIQMIADLPGKGVQTEPENLLKALQEAETHLTIPFEPKIALHWVREAIKFSAQQTDDTTPFLTWLHTYKLLLPDEQIKAVEQIEIKAREFAGDDKLNELIKWMQFEKEGRDRSLQVILVTMKCV